MGEMFYGNKVSEYGIKRGYVDYATLAKSFNAVFAGDLMQELQRREFDFEQINGFVDNSEKISETEDDIEDIEDQLSEVDEEIDRLEEDGATDTDVYDNLTSNQGRLLEELQNLEDKRNDLESESEPTIYRYYIIDDDGVRILKHWTNEPVFVCEGLDLKIWGVTVPGDWEKSLTDIKLSDIDQ